MENQRVIFVLMVASVSSEVVGFLFLWRISRTLNSKFHYSCMVFTRNAAPFVEEGDSSLEAESNLNSGEEQSLVELVNEEMLREKIVFLSHRFDSNDCDVNLDLLGHSGHAILLRDRPCRRLGLKCSTDSSSGTTLEAPIL